MIKSNLAEAKQHGIEQVGSWDPFPNNHGEQLVGLNLNRIAYWIGKGAEPSDRVAELLGLAGILPVHPHSYLLAHRTRLATAKYLADMEDQAKNTPAVESDSAAEPDSSQSETPDPKKRPDSVWRVGNEPPWWWYHGLR